MFNLSKKEFRKIDKVLLFSFISLVVFGLIVLNSAISPSRATIKSQLISTVSGFIMLILILFMDLDFLKKFKWLIYAIIVVSLATTLFFGFGLEDWGGRSWLKFGPINIQPSELVKVALIVFLAIYLDENRNKINTIWFVVKYLFFSGVPIFLIMRQPDFGTSMVFVFIVVTMLFIAGFSWKNIAISIGLATIVLAISVPIIWSRMDEYQKNRILDFGNTERNLSGSGYQTEQGIIALGSGQLRGRGYMQGPFSQNRYIPESHTDFIFPVLVEELGFLGGAVTIVLFLLLLWRILKIASDSTQLFHSTMSVGIFSLIFIHIFENIGMTMRLMPVTGIPLPFFSHGGTFQMVNIICIALIFSINVERKALDF